MYPPPSEGQGALQGGHIGVCVSAPAHGVAALSKTSRPLWRGPLGEAAFIPHPPGPGRNCPVRGASGRPELPIWRWVPSVRWVPTTRGPWVPGLPCQVWEPCGRQAASPQPPPCCSVACARRTGAARGPPMGPAAQAHLDAPPVTARTPALRYGAGFRFTGDQLPPGSAALTPDSL